MKIRLIRTHFFSSLSGISSQLIQLLGDGRMIIRFAQDFSVKKSFVEGVVDAMSSKR